MAFGLKKQRKFAILLHHEIQIKLSIPKIKVL